MALFFSGALRMNTRFLALDLLFLFEMYLSLSSWAVQLHPSPACSMIFVADKLHYNTTSYARVSRILCKHRDTVTQSMLCQRRPYTKLYLEKRTFFQYCKQLATYVTSVYTTPINAHHSDVAQKSSPFNKEQEFYSIFFARILSLAIRLRMIS